MQQYTVQCFFLRILVLSKSKIYSAVYEFVVSEHFYCYVVAHVNFGAVYFGLATPYNIVMSF